MRHEGLKNYLHAMDAKFGCVPKYESQFSGQPVGWLTGHYAGLLDEVIALAGRDLVVRLIEADEAREARIAALLKVDHA